MAAVIAHGDRRPGLNNLALPVLVIHGADDPLITLAGGKDTAANIPDSKLMIIDGMGHDLPRGTWPKIVEGISILTSEM